MGGGILASYRLARLRSEATFKAVDQSFKYGTPGNGVACLLGLSFPFLSLVRVVAEDQSRLSILRKDWSLETGEDC